MQIEIRDLTELVEFSRSVEGSYFFSLDTMKFFGTRLPDRTIYAGRYFITDDRRAPDGLRYKVWSFVAREEESGYRTLSIEGADSVRFGTLKEARGLCKRLVTQQDGTAV